MLIFLVISTVVALPFIYLNSALDPVLIPTFVLLSSLLVLLLVSLLMKVRKRHDTIDFGVWRRHVFAYYGAYVLLGAISVIQAINFSEAVFELLRMTLAAILLLVTATVFVRSENFKASLAKSMVACGFVLAVIGICQYYNLAFTSIPGNGIPYGTMANKGLYSSILCLVFPFTVYGALRFSSYWRISSVLSLASILLITIVAQTRSAWVAMASATVVTLPIFFIWLRKTGSLIVSKRTYLIGVGTVLIIVLAVFSFAGKGYLIRSDQGSLKNRVMSIIKADDSSVKERLILWQKSLQMFRDHPLAGVGVGNCKIVFPSYGIVGTRQESGEVFFQRPHNDYLWVLTETGVFGLISYLMIFTTIITYAYRIVRRSQSEDDIVFVLVMLFAIVSYTTDSFFSFPKERITHLTFLALIMASVVAIHYRTFPSPRKISRRSIRAVLSMSLVICIVSAVAGIVRLQSEVHTKKALIARAAADWPTVVTEIDKARSWLATVDPTSTPLAWYRGVANYSLNNTDQAYNDFSEAYRDNPNHVHVLNNLATCCELKGNHEEAIAYYRRLLQINSHFSEAWLNLTAVYYNLGRYQDAYQSVSQVDSNYADPKLPLFRQKVMAKMREDSLQKR